MLHLQLQKIILGGHLSEWENTEIHYKNTTTEYPFDKFATIFHIDHTPSSHILGFNLVLFGVWFWFSLLSSQGQWGVILTTDVL